MRLLLIAFVAVPIVEIYLLIRVGQWLGAWPTIAAILITALLGAWLLRQQGLATLARGRARLQGGELPTREMIEAVLLAMGGALLLTPGFLTDVFGLLCLLPVTRHRLARAVLRGAVPVTGMHWPPGGHGQRGPRADVRPDRDGHHTIEGEFSREKDRPDP